VASAALAQRIQNLRQRTKIQSEQVERRLAIAGAAGLIGFLESRGTLPISVANVPTKLALGVGAAIAETQFTGSSRRLIGALADAALAVYVHDAAKNKTFIAGEDYVGGEISVDEI
jgi:hypothetical protein